MRSIGVFLITVLLGAFPAVAQEATLRKATLYTTTGPDDKDHDTCFTVELRVAQGAKKFAYLNSTACSPAQATRHLESSKHEFDLELDDRDNLPKSDAVGFRVRISQQTVGNDTWKFHARVVLYFSDFSFLSASQNGITLVNNGAAIEFRSDTASPAPRTMVRNGESDQVAVFRNPSIADEDLIRAIAAVGTPRFVRLPAKANLAQFIAEKCGKPSPAKLIHPAFEEILLRRNPSLWNEDLTSIMEARTVEVPACAVFQQSESASGSEPSVARIPVERLEVKDKTLPDLIKFEGPVRFVTAVDPADSGPSCMRAHDSIGWPYHVRELVRVLSLTDLTSRAPGKVLVVDTGFDFSDGDHTSRIKLAFPERYFHRFPMSVDPDAEYDENGDTVNGNGGWAGVNLTAKGAVGSVTSTEYDYRSHGLSVLTLALGGRGVEEIRRIASLPLKVGVASLVPRETQNPRIDRGHIERAINYAAAYTNNFDVINLSVSSTEAIEGLEALVRQKARGRLIVVAAGNVKEGGQRLTDTEGVWPAALGGKATSKDDAEGAFVTVGAHDSDNARAKFSNWGDKVDILAPGCMVPSYQLDLDEGRNVRGIVPANVNGTSFAAPLVSFAAAILASSDAFRGRPGLIKNRIQLASDFNYQLWDEAYSSGTLNIAKVIGFQYSVLEVKDSGGIRGGRIKYGIVRNAAEIPKIQCSGETFDFKDIKKIARDRKDQDRVLIFVNRNHLRPDSLERKLCSASALQGWEYEYDDAEEGIRDGKRSFVKAAEVWDYVAKR